MFDHALAALRQEFADGLRYTHGRANANTSRLLDATAFLYALVELLAERGIISVEELDAARRSSPSAWRSALPTPFHL